MIYDSTETNTIISSYLPLWFPWKLTFLCDKHIQNFAVYDLYMYTSQNNVCTSSFTHLEYSWYEYEFSLMSKKYTLW